MNGRPQADRGFTLIEVMMAGAILMIGAAALMSGYHTVMQVAEHQRRLSAATHVTQGKVETLLGAKTGAPILAGTGTTVYVDGLGLPSGTTLTPKNYEVTWVFTPNTPVTDFTKIVVTTRWRETEGFRVTKYVTGRYR